MDRLGILRKLTPRIGAEIIDVDLANPTDALVNQVRRDLLDNLVIFFRDQDLTIEQLKDFGKRFGVLHVHPAVRTQVAGHPEIVIIEADENTKSAPTEVWHTDASADSSPPLGSILHMVEAPPNGGDTLWASTYAAYETLSPSMKAYLADKSAVHDAERLRSQNSSNYIRNDNARLISSDHPIVRTHPETGRKSLFVNRVYTSHIDGIPRAESDAILEFLYKHMEQSHFQCRFKWQKNSVAFWDNRCTLHAAVWDYHPNRRLARRVTICGDVPR